jgi:hypothetical protein
VAAGCAVAAFLFLERYRTMDLFHENGERIFLVENHIQRGGSRQLWGDAPRPLIPPSRPACPGLPAGPAEFLHTEPAVGPAP